MRRSANAAYSPQHKNVCVVFDVDHTENGQMSNAMEYLEGETLKKNVERSRSSCVTPWLVATLYTRAGMKEEALDWFDKAYEARDPNMPSLSVNLSLMICESSRACKPS